MFIVHGCCPSCDLFGVHFSFSVYSILSSLLLLVSISKFSMNNSYLIYIPFQMGTNRAICECPCGLHIFDCWNFTAKRALQIYILLRWREEGFLDLLSMMSVNHSCQRDICQIIFKTTRFSPFELFWTYQKNFVLEELWKNLKKQEIDLFTLCSYIILKQNSYFPYFVFICSFAQIVKISHLLLERFSLLIFLINSF